MTREEFLELTPREFFEALQEKEKHEEALATYQVRSICETLRAQTWHLVNVQGAKVNNPQRLMKFRWDKPEVKPAQTQEEMRAIMKSIALGWSKSKS